MLGLLRGGFGVHAHLLSKNDTCCVDTGPLFFLLEEKSKKKTKQKSVASLKHIAEPKQISGNIFQSKWNQNFITPLSVKLERAHIRVENREISKLLIQVSTSEFGGS